MSMSLLLQRVHNAYLTQLIGIVTLTAKPFPVYSVRLKRESCSIAGKGHMPCGALQPSASWEKGLTSLIKYTLFGVADQDKKMMQN